MNIIIAAILLTLISISIFYSIIQKNPLWILEAISEIFHLILLVLLFFPVLLYNAYIQYKESIEE